MKASLEHLTQTLPVPVKAEKPMLDLLMIRQQTTLETAIKQLEDRAANLTERLASAQKSLPLRSAFRS